MSKLFTRNKIALSILIILFVLMLVACNGESSNTGVVPQINEAIDSENYQQAIDLLNENDLTEDQFEL